MSRRSRTTLTIQVRLPLPPGATQKAALAYVCEAIGLYKGQVPVEQPMRSINIPEVQVKIVQRDTHYL